MTRTLPQAYFDNKIEQARIKEAVLSAIPADVYYHNLIIAFAEMLARFTEQAYRDEVYKKAPKKPAA